ncbi:iron transporter [Halarcobacter ebronensis]|uniref:Iron transporter n=1 Tax=Halarcobacter ebronensis TaxID=1462615 RepID=A0A4Q0YKA5_9BACT|nr:FeoA family protein [Halarcobacter ebronensis]QKF82869.1 ferrous iron transport protein A [Halarcobacter ebronensis]RXJ69619.1 iron transporter [Halarcobacter ebronensis]RXK06888.1 iron transporter [Halarcobacter ebronensis]
MRLSELQKGMCGKIIAIDSEPVLKSRFSSFGIVKGAIVSVLEQTLSKNTIEIKVQNTKIAIRISEAETIEIENSQC